MFAPVAQEMYYIQRREVPRRLYAAVGMDHLSPRQIHLYAGCLEDGPLRIEALRRAQAAEGPEAFPKGSLTPSIINTLVLAKDYVQADAELEGYLSVKEVPPRTRASVALSVATMMLIHGERDRARRWLQRVVDDFPEETSLVKGAKQLMDTGIQLPIGRGNK